MPKIRVGQLAKELNLKVAELVDRLRGFGVEVKSNLSTIDEATVERVRGSLSAAPAATATKATKPIGAAPLKTPAGPAPKAAPRAATAPPPTPPAQAKPVARPATAASPGTVRAPHPVAPQAKGTVKPAPAGGVTHPPPAARPTIAPAASRAASSTIPSSTAQRVGPSALRPASPQPVRSPTTTSPLPARPGTMRIAPGTPMVRTPSGAAQPRPTPTGPTGAPLRPHAATAKPFSGTSAAPPRPATSAIPTLQRPGPAARPVAAPPARPSSVPPRGHAAVAAHSAHLTTRPARSEPAMPPPRPAPPAPPPIPEVFKEITITEGVTVKELSEKMDRKAKDIITRLIAKGILATINQPLDTKLAQEVCREFGFDAKVITFEEEVAREEAVEAVPANLRGRHPVVTIMGHVDHGKTSLLDAIRESNIVAGEAGGITQHIGAYHIRHRNRGITFIDTPGHEAFTMMRARGARVTDIVVLVVAADDGVMPQTTEAIDHARAAGVPLVVAINKIDKAGANLDRVKKQLSDHGLLVEDWGGDVVAVPISAKQKTGIMELLEMVLLVADIADLKADPTSLASGTVLESRLDKSRGPVATVLVQRGTLKIGDPFIAGAVHGKVRAMFDDLGHRVRDAGPSIPVEVLGLEGVPRAGDPFQVLEEEWKVRQIGAFRQQKLRQEAMAKSSRLTLDHLYQQIREGTVKELPLVVKADVQGSIEALAKTLDDLPSDKVKIKVIHAGTGAITESDVLLASASNAIIIGFNVRPERSAQELAEKEKVDLRLHSIIYDVANEIRNAMVGLLEPESKEVYLGRAEVRQVFKVPKIGSVAGCLVSDGRITRTAEVRLLRDNVVVYTGKVSSLRRFKDDASEVKAGYECGIGLANYNDLKAGDVIEAFKVEKVAVKSL